MSFGTTCSLAFNARYVCQLVIRDRSPHDATASTAVRRKGRRLHWSRSVAPLSSDSGWKLWMELQKSVAAIARGATDATNPCGGLQTAETLATQCLEKETNKVGLATHTSLRRLTEKMTRWHVINSGAALFLDPEMSFSRPRDWSILFSAAACLFFDLQLFFSPAMRPRKRAQSFFQPLCIILSSLFLDPETSCSEPRIFFRTPRHLFLDLRCFFLTSAGETHTQGEIKSKSQIRKDAN